MLVFAFIYYDYIYILYIYIYVITRNKMSLDSTQEIIFDEKTATLFISFAFNFYH